MASTIKIQRIKMQIQKLGPLLPGSISKQWNVCGVPSCRCKDPMKPQKHGPYYQLSFSVRGKSSSMFLKKGELAEARKRIKNYQKFKDLSFELVQEHVQLARSTGLTKKDNA